MSDLKTRKRIGDSVDLDLYAKLTNLSKLTRINRSRLLDEAIEDLLKKHETDK